MIDNNIAAVQFEIKLFNFHYQFTQLTYYIYLGIYCKLSRCIGQTLCLFEHYLVVTITTGYGKKVAP